MGVSALVTAGMYFFWVRWAEGFEGLGGSGGEGGFRI